MKLLAIGDMHLGRRPSRLPGGLEGGALGPVEAWRQCVRQAIDRRVTAVLLAGDVVDRERDFFEAYRELEAGVRDLVEEGISVLAVAGNHDVQVLPRLADQLEGFRLLGRGGCWETVTLEAGEEHATVWGWSFPHPHVTTSPLEAEGAPGSVGFDAGTGPRLGLLHADRDQPASTYAPVSGSALDAAPIDAWLLGHVHQPDPLTEARPSGYLGSVSAADPGEAGARGPWLLEIDRGRLGSIEHLPLAPLRYEALDIDLSGLNRPEDGRARVLQEVRELDRMMSGQAWVPVAVALRLRLGGRTDFGAEVGRLFEPAESDHIFSGEGGTRYFVEHCELATRPAIELTELARRGDPVGILAGRLLLLDRATDDPDRRELVRGARRRLDERRQRQPWQGLKGSEADEDKAIELLRGSGMRLLEEMLAQSRSHEAGAIETGGEG